MGKCTDRTDHLMSLRYLCNAYSYSTIERNVGFVLQILLECVCLLRLKDPAKTRFNFQRSPFPRWSRRSPPPSSSGGGCSYVGRRASAPPSDPRWRCRCCCCRGSQRSERFCIYSGRKTTLKTSSHMYSSHHLHC